MGEPYDAIVVGSGPNGLAAAIELARHGVKVLIVEQGAEPGGGMRSCEATLPGFVHDVCAAIHPFGVLSPFFRSLPLSDYGMEWLHPDAPLAHPLDDGSAVMLERSLEETCLSVGLDARAYRSLVGPLASRIDQIAGDLLGPPRLPRHPLAAARLGVRSYRSAAGLARARFSGDRARAVLGGVAAHSMLRLNQLPTGAVGVLFSAVAHAHGWPMVRGGTGQLAKALVAHLESLGGEVVCNWRVESVDELPASAAVMLDLTPRQVLQVAGGRLPDRYRRQLGRFRYGSGVFKVDWALDGPIPWKAQECHRAGTVHLGGTLEEIIASEDAVVRGEHPERPYMLVAQQSLFDATRAPAGKHTAWAYCHVPNGSTVDLTQQLEAQMERFAPGFRDRILARATKNTVQMHDYNPNYVGGDINGGAQDLRQHLLRPVPSLNPYATPDRSLYICSSSTPPGGGVHGMCGYHAARSALRRTFAIRPGR